MLMFQRGSERAVIQRRGSLEPGDGLLQAFGVGLQRRADICRPVPTQLAVC